MGNKGIYLAPISGWFILESIVHSRHINSKDSQNKTNKRNKQGILEGFHYFCF